MDQFWNSQSDWFTPGARYKVLKDINSVLKNSRGEPFISGETVRFEAKHYSRYDGATGYSFLIEGEGGEANKRWFDIYDNEPAPNWSEYFELLKP